MATTAVGRTLARSEWRVLVILGVPTFALALAITTVSTYLPVLAEDFSASSIVIGLLIGGEGLMALWLPLGVGSWSDRLRTPLGSRLPFIIAATPPLVIALAVLGFVHSIALAAVVVAVFFVGYFVAYEPYRALYPDLPSDELSEPKPTVFGRVIDRIRLGRGQHLGLRMDHRARLLDHRLRQIALGGKMVMDARLPYAHRLRDVGIAEPVVAAGSDECLRTVKDAVDPLIHILPSTR